MKNHCFPVDFVGFTYVREVSAFMQYWGQLEANLSLPGVILVLFWSVLGPTWSILAPAWAQLGRSWCQLGVSWGHLGAQLGQPSVPGGDQKRCQVDLVSVCMFVLKNKVQCRLTKRFKPGCEAFRWEGSKEGSTPGFPPWPFCLPRSGRLGVPMPSVSLNLRSLCAGFA